MSRNSDVTTTRHGSRFLKLLLIVLAGIVISRAGAMLVSVLGLPIYFDCLGIVLASALGGVVPGILVGFLSNLVGGLSDINTAYYSSTSVMIALVSAYFAHKGYFKRLSRLIIPIICLALIGGGIGSVLTWHLFGQEFGVGNGASLAHFLYDHCIRSEFWAQFTADFLIDIVDKAITVFLAFVILKLIPEHIQEKIHFYDWRQTPLPQKERSNAQKRPTRGLSLQKKILFILAGTVIVIAVMVTGISFTLYRNAMTEQEIRMGYGVANVVSDLVNRDRVDEFLRDGENAPEYKEIDKAICDLLNSSEDIAYIYVYKILEDGCHVVFDADTPELQGGNPGDVVEFDESFRDMLPALLAGKEIDPVISDDTYGWLLTIYKPLYDKDGNCVCYAGVDISMAHIRHTEMIFLTRVIALFIGFFLLVLTLEVYLAEYRMILPINTIAMAAGNFAFDSEGAREENVEHLKRLRITTGDEIENLYTAFTKTTEETMEYIEHAEKQNEKIAKMQNGLIFVLADLVESRDLCTGNHIRNTASYARIIMDQMRKDGAYTDQLTDEFCEDVVNSAPLHDIGKIQVPDAILNKPGKLTDEEFDIMKTHAAAGGEIIDQAIAAVSEEDSGYLKEARNLAAYHHEKWNGKGYPDGLSGEEIPLSARIMAVADVFDALVSKRSYKDGFPFEKAVGIIEEGSGSHFDPKIVDSFLKAQDEIRAVAESKT